MAWLEAYPPQTPVFTLHEGFFIIRPHDFHGPAAYFRAEKNGAQAARTGAGGGLLGAWRQETVFGLRRVLQRPHNAGSPVC